MELVIKLSQAGIFISRPKFLLRHSKNFFAHFFRILSWDLKTRIQRLQISWSEFHFLHLNSSIKFFILPQVAVKMWSQWRPILVVVVIPAATVLCVDVAGQIFRWMLWPSPLHQLKRVLRDNDGKLPADEHFSGSRQISDFQTMKKIKSLVSKQANVCKILIVLLKISKS